MSYNPIPPRVWSRVQNPCTFIDPNDQYLSSYIPLTGQTVSQAQADYEMKQLYKGNILQYKGNSARLTKSQKYSQLARCAGPNRKKVFATQSETYTNPNTSGLLRQNSITYPFPNQIVGAPNNISGPFAYNIPNPNNCPGFSIEDGGTLVCGTYINPCSGEIIKKSVSSPIICNPASASNVPGSAILCWNTKAQSWFPKSRYVMNNSTDKWPINYKGLVSAITCTNSKPKLDFQGFDNNIYVKNIDFNTPFDSIFNLYEDTTDYFKDITDIYFTNTELANMGLTNTDLVNMGLINTDLTNTDLTNTDLTNTDLTNTDLINMGLTNTDLTNKELINTDLTNTDLINMGLTNTDLTNTDLINTDLNNTDTISRDVISYNIVINLKPNSIFKVDSFNIYIDGKFHENVVNNNTYKHTITNINKLNCVITITSITNGIESRPSEPFLVNYTPVDTSPLPPVDRYSCNIIDVCKKLDEKFPLMERLIDRTYSATTKLSDQLVEFQLLQGMLESDIVTNISDFVNKYVTIMHEDEITTLPADTFNALKVDLNNLQQLLNTDPGAIVTEKVTTKNIDMLLLKSKSKVNINQKNTQNFLSPDSFALGELFLNNYNQVLSLMKSAYDKKLEARSAVLDSQDWKKDSEILNNTNKLRQYIEEVNKTINLFKLDIQPIPVQLKQQYVVYHSLYGIPRNLDYDPALMGPILKDLGITIDLTLAPPK
jgi:hypothetical protein